MNAWRIRPDMAKASRRPGPAGRPLRCFPARQWRPVTGRHSFNITDEPDHLLKVGWGLDAEYLSSC